MRQSKKRNRGDKRSKLDELKITVKIQDLLPKHNDQEIMKILKIPTQTFYRHKNELYKQAHDLWRTICTDSLALQALEMKRILHHCYQISASIAVDPKNKPEERMEACSAMIQLQMDHLELLIEGPQYLKKQYLCQRSNEKKENRIIKPMIGEKNAGKARRNSK